MGSLLIVEGSAGERRQKALDFVKHHKISLFDTLIVEPLEPGNSIGINQIRELKAKILLKPFNSSHKLILVFDFEKATTETQNAFLKTLEEPPEDTIIVLTARNKDLLLPTVVSRCQVIQLLTTNPSTSLRTSELEVKSKQLAVIFEGGVGEKLVLAQEVSKNKEEATSWLEKMILFLRQDLINNFKTIGSLQKTHTLLSTTNVSPRLALENCFLLYQPPAQF